MAVETDKSSHPWLSGGAGSTAPGWIPGRKGVQAPLAPGFYRSCAAALTDGFRPQSGPVQREFLKLPLAAGKTVQPGSARGNAPLLVLTHHFPRRGKSSCHSSFVLIRNSKIRAAKISPSGGDVAAGDRRGAFPSRRRRGCTVLRAKQSSLRRKDINCARRAPPQPLGLWPIKLKNPRPEGPSILRTFLIL